MRKYNAYSMTFIVLLIVFILVIVMSITNVVESLAQHESKRRFKNLYARYSQALLITASEMSADTGCYYSSVQEIKHNFSNCDNFYRMFVTNLQLEKYCKENALKDGCIPQYEEYTTRPQCPGFTRAMMNNYADAFVMKDGSNIIVYNEIDKQRKPIFAVDVNGHAKPNRAGEDIFSLTILRDKNGSYYFHENVSHCLPVKKGGIYSLSDINESD